jgi:hypothetical protein
MSNFFHELFAFRFKWIGKLFKNENKPFLQAAINITNVVKNAVNSKLFDFLTSVIPGTVDNSIVEILRKQVPVILADELLIQSTGATATEADAQVLAQKLIDSFGALSDVNKEKFFTSVAAKIYIFLQAHEHGEKVTFGEAATLAESSYQDWLASQQPQS